MIMTNKQTALDWFIPPMDPSRYQPIPWDRADWQRIWIGTQRRPWRTLAVVPADLRISTFEIASLITALGLQRGEPIGLADVRNLGLERVATVLEMTERLVESGERIVFAARSISENLSTIPIAQAVDGVLLCASVGSTPLALLEETVAQIGKERFVGSLLIDLPAAAKPGAAKAPASRVGEGASPLLGGRS